MNKNWEYKLTYSSIPLFLLTNETLHKKLYEGTDWCFCLVTEKYTPMWREEYVTYWSIAKAVKPSFVRDMVVQLWRVREKDYMSPKDHLVHLCSPQSCALSADAHFALSIMLPGMADVRPRLTLAMSTESQLKSKGFLGSPQTPCGRLLLAAFHSCCCQTLLNYWWCQGRGMVVSVVTMSKKTSPFLFPVPNDTVKLYQRSH